jgi:SAM-dependent methyltransferase
MKSNVINDLNTTTALAYNTQVTEYEDWFEKYPHVFRTEVEAIRQLLPRIGKPEGLEIGVATGRFAKELEIRHGIEPAENMRKLAMRRGVHAIPGSPENLPYRGRSFDFVLMNFCLSYLSDPAAAFGEAWRVLKPGGCIIIGFIDKTKRLVNGCGATSEAAVGSFTSRLYSTEELKQLLLNAGFRRFEFSQTLFRQQDKPGCNGQLLPGAQGDCYIMLKAVKGR